MCTPAMTETHRFTEPVMSRTKLTARRSMLVLVLATAAALSACADPTAPTSRSATAGVRHSGYMVSCGDKDSTNAGGTSGQ